MMEGKSSARKGQAMLLTVFALGGAILGATTIAGTIMLYQIRATNDSANSAKALFAADSGVEWALFDFFCQNTAPPRCSGPQAPPSPLANGALIDVRCYDATNIRVPCDAASGPVVGVSKGISLTSKRAFFLNYAAATTSFP